MKRLILAGLIVLALGAVGLFLAFGKGPAGNGQAVGITVLGRALDAEDIALGESLYAEYCAACHGANLEGQPDWQTPRADGSLPAPPHDATGHTWHHPDRMLTAIILDGMGAVVPDYQGTMPPFRGVLSEEDAARILGFIKSRWPERERAYQAEVTANDSRQQ